jgi:hypothetical protein
MPVEQQAQAVVRNREDGELLGLPQPSVPALRRITDAVLADIADDRPGGMGAGGGIAPRTLAKRFAKTSFGLAE